jgi:rare lipoprotein A
VFDGDDANSEGDDDDFVKVYGRSPATWYGPGFWGEKTACGERLQRGTLGVAHRTLPCGTKVSLLYRGRTITVPVIDRGPYGNADWDLTQETAERLRFRETSTIGVTR